MSYNYDPDNQYDPYGVRLPQHYLVSQSARNIKSMARQTLKGHWGEAILAAFIMEAIMSGPRAVLGLLGNSGILSFISEFYSIVITGPANVGLVMFFMGIFRMQDPEKRIIYRGFQDKVSFAKGMLLYCSMMIRIIFLTFLFVIPGIIATFKYSMAFRVMADHPEYTPSDCLRASANMMSGNKMKLFLVELSFWFLALIVSLPRGMCTQQALSEVQDISFLFTDMEVFNSFMNETLSNPWIILTYVLTVILNVYIQVTVCCFYDLAAGNLVVKQSDTGAYGNGDQ